MYKYNKTSRVAVIFLGVFLLAAGVCLPLVFPGFDSIVGGSVAAVMGLSTLVLFAPKRFWISKRG